MEFEAAMGQAAKGGRLAGSASISGGASSAIPAIWMLFPTAAPNFEPRDDTLLPKSLHMVRPVAARNGSLTGPLAHPIALRQGTPQPIISHGPCNSQQRQGTAPFRVCCRNDAVDLSETLLPRRMTMERYEGLTPEKRARITQIQDLLIERYVEQKEVIEEGREIRAKELEVEINDLLREKEHVEEWAAVGSA
ncbi:MAG: hypothetical protein WB710_13915 [Stellaceae bacterium]